MKKGIVTLLSMGTILFGADNPPAISMLHQYVHSVVNATASLNENHKQHNKNLTTGVVALGSDSYNIVDTTLFYSYKNKYAVALYLPFVSSSMPEATTQNGVGDTTVEISFDAGNFEDDMEFENNIFALRYTFATGDEKKSLGMGHDSVAIFWDSVYKLNNKWTIYGNLLWNFYFNDITVGGKSYSMGSEDLLWFGFKHQSFQKIDTMVKVNWQGKYNDIPGQNYDMVDVTLEVQSDKLLKDSFVEAGIKLPVWQSSDVDNELLIFVGISGFYE
jgi:hypothetical protein